MMFKDLSKKLLSINDPIIISTHCFMDGDAIGSIIALAHALKEKGKKVSILNQEVVPEQFKFLQQYFDSFALEDIKKGAPVTSIVVDSNDLNKVGSYIKAFLLDEIKVSELIFIDHHKPKHKIKNAEYYISESSSSTGEIIYRLITEGFELKIDTVLAEAIYTAIVCDTRSFRYSRTNAYSHQVASDLIKQGIEPEKIQTQLFGCNALEHVQLLGYALTNTKLSNGGKVAYTLIPLDKMQECKASSADTKGFINNLLTIKNIEVAVLFRQDKQNSIKVSIRSKGSVDIQGLAEKLGGGGHKFAATFTSVLPYEELHKNVLAELDELIKGSAL